MCFICVCHLRVSSVCFICVFHLCVSSVCFICVFHPCVSSVCFVRVFHQCVSSVCFISVFHPCVLSVCLCKPTSTWRRGSAKHIVLCRHDRLGPNKLGYCLHTFNYACIFVGICIVGIMLEQQKLSFYADTTVWDKTSCCFSKQKAMQTATNTPGHGRVGALSTSQHYLGNSLSCLFGNDKIATTSASRV